MRPLSLCPDHVPSPLSLCRNALQHKRPRPKSMHASNGEAQRSGVSLLPSLLSSVTAPLVASPVVPAGESNIVFLSLILFLLLFQCIAYAAFSAFPLFLLFFKVK